MTQPTLHGAVWLTEAVRAALTEDIGRGDLTTEALVPPDKIAQARIIAKAPGRICGLPVALCAFRLLDPNVEAQVSAQDGTDVQAGTPVITLRGRAAALLTAERVALNYLQRLSGIATTTQAAVRAAAAYGARIVDTRKTTPGLRTLEKYAVRVGGGHNHRFGLDDAILIKENHIAMAGGVAKAVAAAKARSGHLVKIEVEIERLDQLDEALSAGADVIMLDNMSPADMQQAVAHTKGRAVLEASGGITPEYIAEVAATGVDVISIGWITHSVPALDLSLRLNPFAAQVEG